MCGGFVGDILDGVGDLIEGVGDVVGDVVEGVVDVVEDVGRGIDDFVRDVIPGGWGGVAGLGLLAVGIANPTLLGLAEGGALTTEAVAAAGLDAAAVAEAVAAVTPEVLAATEAAVASGIAPEVIAMANATLDPIAALNAAAGWTAADTAYLATIGATPELLALAEANNAALAAGTATEGGAAAGGEAAAGGGEAAVTPGGETATQPGVTTNPDGSTTQIFDDGSTLTTAADGTVSSTPATDIVTPTTTPTTTPTDGLPPVEDLSGTGVPGTNNPYGNADIPLGTALKDYAGAVYDSLGPLGTAGLVGGAALASGLLTPSNLGGPVGSGDIKYEWGQGIAPVNPGLNPGYIGYPASMADYETTSPTQARYYWGDRPGVTTEEQLANYNELPAGAPATPWGLANSAVGGTAQLNIPNFVDQYITNPSWSGVMSGTAPGYTPPAAPVAPTAPAPLSLAQQAMAALQNSGAPGAQLSLPGPVVPV